MNKFFQNRTMIIILIVILLLFLILFKKEKNPSETAVKDKTTQKIEIETIEVKKEDKPIVISAYGKAQAHRTLTIQSEVKGRIIEQSPNLDAGGILNEGEIILKLDPRDYLVDVEQNRAKVEKAEFELVQEKGKKVIAEREWDLLDSSLKQGGIGKDLALRIPHLREKESALHAAESSLEKSLVDLKRTLIRAPFNCLVLEEFVEKGQFLMPQTKIATVISTDEFRVQVSIPYDQISQIKDLESAKVKVIQELGKDRSITREGSILRYVGGFDPNGRMVQLIVVIKDPLNLEKKNGNSSPLLLNTPLKIEFDGPQIDNLVVIPKKALHEDNKIWIKNKDNKLEIKQVEVLAEDKEKAFIRGDNLENGELIITSSLSVAIPGMELN